MDHTQTKTEYLDVMLTDIQLHVTQHSHPRPFDRQLAKSLRNGKPGRVYNQLPPPTTMSAEDHKNGRFKINLMGIPEIERAALEAKKQGKKLRILVPSTGLNVYAGKDTVEFIKARENQKWKPFQPLVGK